MNKNSRLAAAAMSGLLIGAGMLLAGCQHDQHQNAGTPEDKAANASNGCKGTNGCKGADDKDSGKSK